MTRPRKTLKASEIIDYCEDPSVKFSVFRLEDEAPVKELIRALQLSTNPKVRHPVCYVLGKRHAKSAVGVLVDLLDDASSGIRALAADSLAKIGDSRAGAPLLHRFTDLEKEMPVLTMLAVALGAVEYRPAIPYLIAALSADDDSLRGTAAWSLGNLQAVEALEPLKEALAKEISPYPSERIRIALDQIASVKNNTKADVRE